jgi:hypothetical protein
MTQATTESKPTVMASRLERKIVISPRFAGYVVAWLQHACLPDPVYPRNLVNSLYLDTPDMDSYYECLNGDIYKNKIRLRWYDRADRDKDVLAYIEIKSKKGYCTSKKRQPVKIPGALLTSNEITGPLIQSELDRALPELGYTSYKPLRPVIIISYRRCRFLDPLSGASMAYDQQITSQMVGSGIAVWSPALELQTTVLEIKNNSMTTPAVIRGLRNIDLGWGAFSKYARCLESHFEHPGSAGWLKP